MPKKNYSVGTGWADDAEAMVDTDASVDDADRFLTSDDSFGGFRIGDDARFSAEPFGRMSVELVEPGLQEIRLLSEWYFD